MGGTWLSQKPVLLISSGVLQGRYFVDYKGVGDILGKTYHGDVYTMTFDQA